MEKRSKELLQLEHKNPTSSKEAALLVCRNGKKLQEEKTSPEGKPATAPPPKSQVLGKVRDFLGVISEANKSLQLNAKDKPEQYDIEVMDGNESEYIEMDLMLGVADLHTPEAMAAAEAAIAGNQPVIDLLANGSSSETESSSDDDDDDEDVDENDEDDNEHTKAGSRTSQESKVQKDGSLREQTPKSKRPKIVELS